MLASSIKSSKAKALGMVGVIFFLVGVTNLGTAHELTPAANQAYKAQLFMFPLTVWGILFMLVGVGAVVCAFLKKYLVGFAALQLFSSFWGLLFVASYALTGYGRIIASIFTWFMISAFLYIVSVWPEPIPVAKPLTKQEILDYLGGSENGEK